MVMEKFPEIKLIRTKRIGIGEAINIGIESAKGDIIGFDLNNDEVFSINWLHNLVKVLLSSSDIGVVGGIRLLYGSNDIIDEAGCVFNFLGMPFCKIGFRLDKLAKGPIDVDYTGTILTTRNIFDKIGKCDEIFHIFGEDSDFCARVKRGGWRILAVPQAISYHKRSSTIGVANPISTYYLKRSRIRIILLHFKGFKAVLSLLWHFLFQTTIEAFLFLPLIKNLIKTPKSRLYFLFQSTTKKNFRATLSAIFWNIKNLKSTIRLRNNPFRGYRC